MFGGENGKEAMEQSKKASVWTPFLNNSRISMQVFQGIVLRNVPLDLVPLGNQ